MRVGAGVRVFLPRAILRRVKPPQTRQRDWLATQCELLLRLRRLAILALRRVGVLSCLLGRSLTSLLLLGLTHFARIFPRLLLLSVVRFAQSLVLR